MARRFVAGMCRAALAALVSTSTSGVALACRSRSAEKAVLLERVPDEARGSPIVARVVAADLYDRSRNAIG